MRYRPAWLTLIALAANSLGACTTTRTVAVPTPCPPLPEPPPSLLAPPESPQTMHRLEEALSMSSTPKSSRRAAGTR